MANTSCIQTPHLFKFNIFRYIIFICATDLQLSQHHYHEYHGYHVGHVAKNGQKLIIFSQNVLKCSCNTELIPEKLVLCSINDLF